jgi:hypothetical protein
MRGRVVHPDDTPRRIDAKPPLDHAKLFDDAVTAIQRKRGGTKSDAIDIAMRDSAARSHYEASLRQSRAANAPR